MFFVGNKSSMRLRLLDCTLFACLDKKGTLRGTRYKGNTVQYSPVNLVGQGSTKSVDSTISSLLQFTVLWITEKYAHLEPCLVVASLD